MHLAQLIRDPCGLTPLHHACVIGRADIARQLIEGGAWINAADDYGETALHKACTRGWEGLVQLLLSYPSVDVNVRGVNRV